MSSKSNITRTQLLLILAGVVVIALILIAPERKSEQREEFAEQQDEHEGHDHQAGEDHEHKEATDDQNSAGRKLDSAVLADLEALEKQAEQVADVETRLNLYDSLIAISIQNKAPEKVAEYSKQKAKAVPTENNWMMAGDNYFKAFRLSKNESTAMINGALGAYEKVLEINPENLDAKTAMGVAYVEGASALGEMPMKGIGILQEVINIDPKNINALTNLGYFAIQSGQYEKAIERFETILQIDPENAEAYIYLTDVYLAQDKVDEGVRTLEKYKELVDDPLVKQQVDDYINEIKAN